MTNPAMTNIYKTSLTALTVLTLISQVRAATYFGSGGGGANFGETISGSSMEWTDDGTTINVTFTKGSGDFNDSLVIYLDNGATGRGSIDANVNDRADVLRSAITYIEANANKTLTFNSGFEATHAIAINTAFGGLWTIPPTGSLGDNGLPYVNSVDSTLSSSAQTSFTFSFDVTDIGLSANGGDTIQFVATYLNPFGSGNSLGLVSNEGYGGGFPVNNIAQENFTFTSSESYTTVPEPTTILLGALSTLLLFRRRR